LSEAVAKRIEDTVRAELEEAVQFALASPFPAPEEATKYVFA
jgi:TPP-dependent pyruvate/acetoin dehydrogenase alpha subunit